MHKPNKTDVFYLIFSGIDVLVIVSLFIYFIVSRNTYAPRFWMTLVLLLVAIPQAIFFSVESLKNRKATKKLNKTEENDSIS